MLLSATRSRIASSSARSRRISALRASGSASPACAGDGSADAAAVGGGRCCVGGGGGGMNSGSPCWATVADVDGVVGGLSPGGRIHSSHPGGGAGQVGSGFQFGGGCQPSGGFGQPGGGLNTRPSTGGY